MLDSQPIFELAETLVEVALTRHDTLHALALVIVRDDDEVGRLKHLSRLVKVL